METPKTLILADFFGTVGIGPSTGPDGMDSAREWLERNPDISLDAILSGAYGERERGFDNPFAQVPYSHTQDPFFVKDKSYTDFIQRLQAFGAVAIVSDCSWEAARLIAARAPYAVPIFASANYRKTKANGLWSEAMRVFRNGGFDRVVVVGDSEDADMAASHASWAWMDLAPHCAKSNATFHRILVTPGVGAREWSRNAPPEIVALCDEMARANPYRPG